MSEQMNDPPSNSAELLPATSAPWTTPPPAPPQKAPAPAYSQEVPQPFQQQPLANGPLVASPTANTAEVVAAWIITVLTAGYMLPWAIAATRGKANSASIALVNFLLGWTFVGWIAALVMACTEHASSRGPAMVTNVMVSQQVGGPYSPPFPSVAPAAGWYPASAGGHAYWDGQRWTGHTAP
jgi:hypothetical protein